MSDVLFEKYSTDSFVRTKAGLETGEILADGDAWPMFLYADSLYDESDLWKGLFRSQLLLNVRIMSSYRDYLLTCFKGFQICLHFAKFRRKRCFKSYALWECSSSWDESYNKGIYRVYCNSGTVSFANELA